MSYFDEQDFGYTTRSRQPSYASDGTVYARSRSIPLSPDLPSFDPLEQPNSLSPGATTVYAYERPISVGRSPSIIDELDSEPRDLQEPMRPSVDQFRRYRSIRPDTPGVPPDSLDIFEQAGRRQSRASFDSSSAFEDTRSTFTVFEAPRSLGPTFSTSGQSPLEHRNSVDTWNGSTNYRTVTPPSPGWRLEPLNGNPNPTPSFGNVIQSIPLSSNPAAPLTSNHTVPQVSEHFSSHQQTRGTRPDSPVRIVLIPPSEPETNTPDGQGTPMPRQPSPEQRTLDSRADVAPSRPSPGAPDFSQIEAWLNRPGTPADVVRRDYFYSDPNASPDKGIRGVLSPAQVKDALAVVNSTIVDVADAPSSSLRSPSPPPSRRTSFASSNVARVNSPPPPPPSSRQPSVTVVDKPVFAGNERPLKSKEEEIISPNNPPATYIDIIYAVRPPVVSSLCVP
ncbi:hypothetical protein CALVIDRAFT_202419 [Calocera viscosa TUFC12733]|uniref:Uncharacterized protein n=1 Tax=Calocera viscosa (strain TUFC12733) TaxID=1330018 RepID=A0A167KAU7_CALVF|nr:hypothetical protein CALVIDRAFT_202419 [Calocera viscosa TUFC12733]